MSGNQNVCEPMESTQIQAYIVQQYSNFMIKLHLMVPFIEEKKQQTDLHQDWCQLNGTTSSCSTCLVELYLDSHWHWSFTLCCTSDRSVRCDIIISGYVVLNFILLQHLSSWHQWILNFKSWHLISWTALNLNVILCLLICDKEVSNIEMPGAFSGTLATIFFKEHGTLVNRTSLVFME